MVTAMRLFPVMLVAIMTAAVTPVMIAAISEGRHGGEHCGGENGTCQ
jgi:hypothetical protein